MAKSPPVHPDRIRRLSSALKTAGVDAMIVKNPVNVRYLCGFDGTYGVLIVDQRRARFVTDCRYTESAQSIVNGAHVLEQPMKDVKGFFRDLLKKADYESVGYEGSITVDEFDSLKSWTRGLKLKLSKQEAHILEMRAVKDESEIRIIRKAAKVADLMMQAALESIRPGVREIEISRLIRRAAEDFGGTGESFDNIVATGRNSSRPHHHPSPSKVKKGDMVTIDLGAVVGGYCSDMTRNPVVGKVSRKFEQIYEVCLAAQKAAVDACRAGVDCRELDGVAREIISTAGYGEYFGHGLGHGVGIEIHEGPRLSPRGAGKLREGHVVTVEPGIYIPGFGGVRIEDLVVVTKGKPKVLSRNPKDLTVLPV